MSAPRPTEIKSLAETVVRALIDHPEALAVTEIDGARMAVLEIRCHPEDVGKIIGKNGKTVSALRTLLGMVAARQNRRVMLEILD